MDVLDSKPLITTVIPTYRRPLMLRRAIRSVLNQTFPDFRLCIYDNASGDETGAVVEEFRKKDSRVEYFCRPENIGMSMNFADGAKRVETPFFSFLPDDDLMLPHFFETALSGFQRHPEAALSILPTLCMSPRGRILLVTNLQWPEGLLLPPGGMLSTLRYGNPGLQAMLIRADVWKKINGFDEDTVPIEELDFDLHVMAHRPVFVSRQPGAIQVMHGGSFTMNAGLEWVWTIPRIIAKVQNMDLPPSVKHEATERLSKWLKRGLVMRGGFRSISDGRWAEARKAADFLEQEFQLRRVAQMIRGTAVICRSLPGTRFFLRFPVALTAYLKAIRNLRLQWRLRGYAKLLSTVVESAQNHV